MKKNRANGREWRIALVWMSGWGEAAEARVAMRHWADLKEDVTIGTVYDNAPAFQAEVIERLIDWQPDGIVARTANPKHLCLLRQRLPGIPIVSTLLLPPESADVCVIADIAEAIAVARDYFHKQGLPTLALYCSCPQATAKLRTDAFRKAVPDGRIFTYPDEEQKNGAARTTPVGKGRVELRYPSEEGSSGEQKVQKWLKKLPKPAGILTTETGAAGFILRQCHHLGLRVPQDVQLIGIDDIESCLLCTPHLTGINLPYARIGEIAIETLLRMLEDARRPSERIVPVAGCALIPRQTTAAVHIGKSSLNKALHALESSGTKGLPSARLARLAGVSRTTLYKEMNSATGQTPGRRLKRLRLHKAIQMLTETSASLSAIAQDCGFSNPFSFSRFFKRETGACPTAYRAKACASPRAAGRTRTRSTRQRSG